MFKSIDTSKLETAGKKYTVYYTQKPNPGLGGFSSMKAAGWSTEKPDDASITGIKVSIEALGAGEGIPFEIKYALDGNKATVGKQIAYQTFYCNYLVNNESYYGNDGYSHPVLEKYVLEDMSITGLVWDETGELPNSIYDISDDKPYKDATIKLLKEDGTTQIKQTNNSDLSNNSKYKTAEDGTYTLYAPCDGNYIVEITMPDGYKLVKKLADTDTSLSSRANKDTGKTDELPLWPNCAQGRYTLADINFGIYKMAGLSITPDDFKVHVTDVATASVAESGYSISLGTDHTISWSVASNSDAVRIKANDDNTADITGLKAGIAVIKASCTDLYDNEISCTNDVIVYARVLYDTTTNKGSGDVKDSGMYYPSSTPSTAVYKVKSSDGVSAPDGLTFVGWSTKSTSTKADFDRAPESEWSIGNDVTGDIVLYAIYYDTNEYTITYKDGKDGIIWADETITVNYGQNTPTTSRDMGIYTDNTATQWSFTGWTPSLEATVTGNATYTANWENIGKDKNVYTVIYTKGLHGAFDDDIYGGLKAGSQVPDYAGAKDTQGVNAGNPKAEAGWIFNGWKPEARAVVNGDITYTAQWKATDDNTDVYRAIFDPGEQGTFEKQIYELLDGEGVSFEGAPTGNAGYRFVGWDSDGDSKVDNELNASITISGSDVTWTAIWEPTDPSNTYHTVTYVRGDKGSFITEYYVVKSGDPTPAFIGSLTSVDDAKYYFRGWSKDGAATISTIAATVTEDAVYTAAWGQYRSVYYSLSFDGDGSEQDKELSETVLDIARGARIKDGDITVDPAFPSDPTKAGYTFKGWKIDSANDPEGIIISGNYLKDSDIMPECDVKLKADWEKIDQPVSIIASDFAYNIYKDKTKKTKSDDITAAKAIELAKATIIDDEINIAANSIASLGRSNALVAKLTASDNIIVDSAQLNAINSAKNSGNKGEYTLTFYTEDYDETLEAGDKAAITVTLYEEKSSSGSSSGGGGDGGTGKHAIKTDETDNKQPTADDQQDGEDKQNTDNKKFTDIILDKLPKLGWQDFDITWPLLILFIAIIYILFKHHKKRN